VPPVHVTVVDLHELVLSVDRQNSPGDELAKVGGFGAPPSVILGHVVPQVTAVVVGMIVISVVCRISDFWLFCFSRGVEIVLECTGGVKPPRSVMRKI
jgi:hypothetical protein